MRARQYALFISLLGAFASSPVCAQVQAHEHWVSAWGTAQMQPSAPDALPSQAWQDLSLRQIVRISLPGHTLRVRVSNAMGTAPLQIDAASVGLALGPGKAGLQAGSVHALRFGGNVAVMVPAGAEFVSDPVDMPVAAGADLAISMHFSSEPAHQTSHPGSRATSFMLAGDHLMDSDWPGAKPIEHWYQLAGVEVLEPKKTGALVAVGDSITDGHGVPIDSNSRWPDDLLRRLTRAHARAMGIVNVGIGGGRLLRDGLGPNLASRFERDVLSRPGVTHALVMIGVNDLGVLHLSSDERADTRRQLLTDLKLGLAQLAARAHEQGICMIGGTVTPYAASDYYHPGPDNEADRQELNAWIRGSGVFDAVADFDAALRDPVHLNRLREDYSLDGLHPNEQGRQAMADAVPLSALRECPSSKR